MQTDEGLAAEQAVEAKLAEAGVDQVRRHSFAEAPETSAPAGTPETVQDQPRNEQGQFTSPATEEQDVAVETPAEEAPAEPQASELDSSVQKLLAKYGGDPNKALAAAVEAQKQLGRQSTEVGELRQQNAEYQAMIAELQGLRQDFQQARQNQPIDQGTVDWFDQQVMSNPQGALEWARQQNNQILVQRGLDTWKEFDPYGAASYRNDLQLAQMRQELEQRQQAQAQLPVDATINLALQNVRSRNPEYATFDEVIGSTLERNPWLQSQLQHAAESGDASQLEGVIETVYGLAQRDTLTAALRAGDTPEDTSTTTDVAVPATSETHDPEPEPSAVDVFRQQFREAADRETRGIWVAQ